MKNQVAYKKIVVKAMVKSLIVTAINNFNNVSWFHFCIRVNVEEHMKETEAVTQRCS